ncbi:ssDNA-binding protein, partial [Allobaculum mucilyticum]
HVQPILDQSEVYSGCYARVSLNFYAFNTNGNKGVACGLGNIQKIKDGPRLGGRTTANDDFVSEDADDDFLS